MPEKLRWCWNEQVCQVVECKEFEQSQRLDAALFKNVSSKNEHNLLKRIKPKQLSLLPRYKDQRSIYRKHIINYNNRYQHHHRYQREGHPIRRFAMSRHAVRVLYTTQLNFKQSSKLEGPGRHVELSVFELSCVYTNWCILTGPDSWLQLYWVV